jgi:ClpP class serine protease
MSIGDLFWLFFIFSAIQPMLRQKMLEAMRVRKISQLERERKSRVILLVHRQETMRLLGFPIARYIDINDSEEVLRAIQMTDPDVPLDLVLHTPGGLVLAALQIAKAVREHKGNRTSRGRSCVVRPKMASAAPGWGRFFDTRGEAAN